MLIKGDDLRILFVVQKEQLGERTPAEFGKYVITHFSNQMKQFGHI